MIGLDLAEQDVAVGDGERPAAAICGGAGVRARAFGADGEPRAVPAADRTSSGCHGVDAQHRGADARPRDYALIVAFEAARIMADVGRGAAHVETDQPVQSKRRGAADHADDPARGARKDRVAAVEGAGRGEAARAFHELRFDAIAQLSDKLIDIVPQDRRQIGIGERRVAAPDQLDERADVVAGRNLRKADLARDRGEALFVRGVAIAMHQYDRDTGDAAIARRLKRCVRGTFVERPQDVAVGADALGDFGNLGVRRRDAVEPPREQVGAVLITDGERIAEPPRDREQGRRALAFEQCVGRDGRTHADREPGKRACARAGEVADRIHRRIARTCGIFTQIFGRDDGAIGRSFDDIGKGAAAVDPDVPAGVSRRHDGQGQGGQGQGGRASGW